MKRPVLMQTGVVQRPWRWIALILLVLLLGAVATMWSDRVGHDLSHAPVARGFMRDMSIHHNQAVSMAFMGALKGSAEIQATSLKIIRGQSLEMGVMQAWTPPSPTAESGPMMGWMADRYARLNQHIPEYDKFISACQANPGLMPGMASLDELNRLQQSSGKEFNRQWITLMIRHHSAAMVMVRFAVDYSESDRVHNLASSMLRDQVQELAYLSTLAQRDGLDAQTERFR
jgi:uncharacterized protein (DUF305 family)